MAANLILVKRQAKMINPSGATMTEDQNDIKSIIDHIQEGSIMIIPG